MKVAVIGSGASGLATIKCCQDEGVEVECFEQGQAIGGLWKYSEHESHSSVYESTVINTSKELSCFSDFPMPKEFAPFLPHFMMLQYYNLYAEQFGLSKYIRFNCKVVSVRKVRDDDPKSKWQVSYEVSDGDVIERETREFDGVFVCTGHLWQPRLAQYPGMSQFRGRIMHSHSYKNTQGFKNKTVLVIGFGNSAADIAVDLSRQAKKVYVSTRRGALLHSRTVAGIPFDCFINSRAYHSLPQWLRRLFDHWVLVKHLNYDHYGLQVAGDRAKAPIVVNDELPIRISTGTVVMKTDVSCFHERSVSFVDKTEIPDLDAVILCTGYTIGFDFLDEKLISPLPNNDLRLYEYVFPPREPNPSLAFIGYITIKGSMNPAFELQARWAVRVFKGDIRLPSEDEMIREIAQTRKQLLKNVVDTPSLTLVANGISYDDNLAQKIGCEPHLFRMLFTDPVLALRCFFGPCHPAQYRLRGPGQWPGARTAIMNAYSNLVYPTMTRTVNRTDTNSNLYTFFSVFKILIVSLFLSLLLYFIP